MKKLSQMVIGLSMVPLSNQWRHSSLTPHVDCHRAKRGQTHCEGSDVHFITHQPRLELVNHVGLSMSALQGYLLLDSDKSSALEIIRQTAKGIA